MERPETKLTEFGAAVRQALSSECHESAEIRMARAGFLQQVAARNATATRRFAHHWRLRPWPSLLLAGAGATAAILIGLWTWSRLPISFEVGATAVAGHPGDLISAPKSEPTSLRFSEGSSLVLHEEGRLRVLATEPKGARVLVEEGTLEVNIVPARAGKKHWSFEAGPFSILVTGTRFKLSYQARDQSLGLAMREGQVIVSSSCLERPTPVSAGGRLDLSCGVAPPAAARPRLCRCCRRPRPRAPRWLPRRPGRRATPPGASCSRPDVCRTACARPNGPISIASARSQRQGAAGPGRRRPALRPDGPRRDRPARLAPAVPRVGRGGDRRLHARPHRLRADNTPMPRRSPGSPPTCANSRAARSWVTRVGRLMEARLRAGDEAGARTDAEQYLRRFPEGPYASEARGILSK